MPQLPYSPGINVPLTFKINSTVWGLSVRNATSSSMTLAWIIQYALTIRLFLVRTINDIPQSALVLKYVLTMKSFLVRTIDSAPKYVQVIKYAQVMQYTQVLLNVINS